MLETTAAFFRWWGEGLRAALPKRFSRRRVTPRKWALVTKSGTGVHVSLRRRDVELVSVTVPLGSSPEYPPLLRKALSDSRTPVVYRLAPSTILAREVRFPASVGQNLAAAIRYEIDRKTPFRAENAYVGFTTAALTGDQLVSTLLVTAKSELDEELQYLNAVGIRPSVVDVTGYEFSVAGVNLLGEARKPSAGMQYVSVAGLIGACLLAPISAPLYDAFRIKQELAALTPVEHDRRRSLEALRPERARAEAMASAERLINEHDANTVRVIDVINEVSRLLPDSSWAYKLSINDGSLTIQGESKDAVELPRLLERSPLLVDPRFSGPLTRNKLTGAERFTLTASLATEAQ